MQKPDDLRAYLVAQLTDLSTNPECLRIWIEEGTIKTSLTASRAFELRYKLNIAIIDYTASPLGIFMVINEWLRCHQPDLIASQAADGYEIQAEIMTNNSLDLALTLPLSEAILCTKRPDGSGWDLIARPELCDDMTGEDAPRLKEIWWRDEQLLPRTSDGG